MKSRPVNPFRVGEIVRGDAYCPRPAAEQALAKLLRGKQRVLLQDERRTGKTSLAYEVARSHFNNEIIRIPLMPASDSMDIVTALLSGWGDYMRQRRKTNWIERLAELGLTVTVDLKVIKIAPQPTQPLDGISQFFRVLDSQKLKPILFFDEFQFAAQLPQNESDKFFWSLRDALQNRPEIAVIFAGSDRNRLTDIFFHAKNPFYNTVHVFELPPIDPAAMREFVAERFGRGGLRLPDCTWEKIQALTRGVPGYVQELCMAIWEVAEGPFIDEKTVEVGVERILRQFDSFRDFVSLTPLQRRFAKSVATLEPSSVTTQAFLDHARIKSSAAALRPLKLFENDLNVIEKRDGRFRFYNPFVAEWFRLRA